MRWLAPFNLILFCWVMTGAIAALALCLPDLFDLVSVFMQREDLQVSRFTWLGAMWLSVALLALWIGDLSARIVLPHHARTQRDAPDFNRLARVTIWMCLFLIAVTGFWILSTAQRIGGLDQLIEMVQADTGLARDVLLENKLFTGMRLFYAALPAVGSLALGVLVAGKGALTRQNRRRCQITFVACLFALSLLPLVMSQRLLLLQFLLSSFILVCIIRRRLPALHWIVVIIAVFFAVWTVRESLTNPHFIRSPVELGLQKLAFYFVNDLWNAFAPLSEDISHTFGTISFSGLAFRTFTDGYFAHLLAPRIEALDDVLGGGAFPLLTAGYVDFGVAGGAMFLVVCAFVFRLCYARAFGSLIWAAVYAQLGASLLFSSHGIYFTHQNFLFSLGILGLVHGIAKPRRKPVRNIPQNPVRPSVPVFVSRRGLKRIPDRIALHMLPFISRRKDTSASVFTRGSEGA